MSYNVNDLIIVPYTAQGTPSGNYDGSSTGFVSDAVKAADYYRGQGNIQTITFRVLGFEGLVTMQATLNEDPAQAAWFDIYTYDQTGAPISDIHPVAITGNFSFVRAVITDFTAGIIDKINIVY